MIEETAGGYLAVVGAAGIGKSTLVQDVLRDFPLTVPYFAYLPEGLGNARDRGEALTFYQDIVARLDRLDTSRRGLGIQELAEGRAALRRHMASAHDRYTQAGTKTILLVDGLDHVQREVGLQHSVLLELPPPAEVPDGFLIVLSGQPQAFLAAGIGPHVSSALRPTSARSLTLEGLARSEAFALVSAARSASSEELKNEIADESSGNPLILTYLINAVNPASGLREAPIARYAGDIDAYYRASLFVSLEGQATRDALALLSRAAPTLPSNWLLNWPERASLESVFAHELASFVRNEDGVVQFIHNSLVAFLREETRSRIPGLDPEIAERHLYSTLAERCAEQGCNSAIGRARISFLLRAKRHQDLLATLTDQWLRAGLANYVPYAEIRPIVLAGFAAAWAVADHGALLRLALLDHECDSRSSRLEPEMLAELFLALARPELAIAQIQASGRLLVDPKEVLDFSAQLVRYATKHSSSRLQTKARDLYHQTVPVALFSRLDAIEPWHDRENYDLLMAWANAAPHFESSLSIIRRVRSLRFVSSQGVNSTPGGQARLLQRSLSNSPDNTERAALLEEIGLIGNNLIKFECLDTEAETHGSADAFAKLPALAAKLPNNHDVRLALALAHLRAGRIDDARETARDLPFIEFDHDQSRHSAGFDDLTYTYQLSRVRNRVGLGEGVVGPPAERFREASARVASAARRLGVIAAEIDQTGTVADIAESFRAVLTFRTRSIRFPGYDHRNEFELRSAEPTLLEILIELARRCGSGAIQQLLAEALSVRRSMGPTYFSAPSRREIAKALREFDVVPLDEVEAFGVQPDDYSSDDPRERQESCLEVAAFLYSIGRPEAVQSWIARSTQVSAGAGNHKDYHVLELVSWLIRSMPHGKVSERFPLLRQVCLVIHSAGGAGQSRAAVSLLTWLFSEIPATGLSLAEELIDRNILDLAECAHALVTAAARVGASHQLLLGIATELLSAVGMENEGSAACAVVDLFPVDRRLDVACEILRGVQVNSIPSARASIARSLEDVLVVAGLECPALGEGIPPGHDDSSMKNLLYRLEGGRLLTRTQMAARIAKLPMEGWNPNPAENSEFDWWGVVERVSVRDLAHLDLIVATFSFPDYRDVSVSAWRSRQLLALGEIEKARHFARHAVDRSLNSSWFKYFDGAQVRVAFAALRAVEGEVAMDAARTRFGADLASGKLSGHFLLDAIPYLFEFFGLAWPAEAALVAIEGYCAEVLKAVPPAAEFESLVVRRAEMGGEVALAGFVIRLLDFPAQTIAQGARRALASYVLMDGRKLPQIYSLVRGDENRLEQFLVVLEIGSRGNSPAFALLGTQLLDLRSHRSVAIRALGRRIAKNLDLDWGPRPKVTSGPTILRPDTELLSGKSDGLPLRQTSSVLNHMRLFADLLSPLARQGHSEEIVRSLFTKEFDAIRSSSSWGQGRRVERWLTATRTHQWTRIEYFWAREAAMRVVGALNLAGRGVDEFEGDYDALVPLYDPGIEASMTVPRPREVRKLDWKFLENDETGWRAGEGLLDWEHYPSTVDGFELVAERTQLRRLEWNVLSESRVRGLFTDLDGLEDEDGPPYVDLALGGLGRLKGATGSIVVFNQSLRGGPYDWAVLNPAVGRRMGWEPQFGGLHWCDAGGSTMVRSFFWRDGRVDLSPPHFEGFGEGWLVVASPQACEAVRTEFPCAETKLWVTRSSEGKEPIHLERQLTRRF